MPSEATLLTPVPLGAGVLAGYTTRAGGVSEGGWASLNLGAHVGDRPEAVQENRARVARALGGQPLYLDQVHGAEVVQAAGGGESADAQWCTAAGPWLAILVADCLPVLWVARDAQGRARAVAASHAGWRGLAAGVLENTARALRQAVPACQLQAWLGPCIGPEAFEVGEPVLRAFGGAPGQERSGFRFQAGADGSPRWRADLQALATERLTALGVQALQAEPRCTVSDASRFFSFRRDGAVSGRFGAFIRLT
ncbi:polyphenol oxidase family protein [Inhella gelatinilytica]|uniref:Laccase domain-containing protein n=1 Tax=Inhella gelatinilytica TaxID=2795030 RepID=A0A931IZ63_9BURK|nr:polyphenol oxidase family protein [Inhella gelatinilytica]MBH9552496.1 laccase domain-containing protein [Inhella gelatinilytica]